MTDDLPQIDLRRRTVERDPEVVRPHATVLEQQLRDALDRSTPSPDMLETLIGLCEVRCVPEIRGTVRADAWREVLTRFRALDTGSLYVGAFKVQLDAIVEAGSPLVGADRTLLARLLLDRTAAMAVTKRDLRVGVRAAHALDPYVLASSVVIDSLLRPCIRWSAGPSASASAMVADAFVLTLDSLGRGSGQSISDTDLWALRAAVSMIDKSGLDAARAHLATITGADRVAIERLLAPEPGRRWWPRSQRRSGNGRSLSLR